MKKIYRLGAAGALLDEYERAITELQKLIESIPDNALGIITDPLTQDENCRSVQTILTHVVHAGYGYATLIYNQKGMNKQKPPKISHETIAAYAKDIAAMFAFTEYVIGDLPEDELQQHDNHLKMMSGWGQQYDIEQMMEHAIVHILRHRRQLEKIKVQLLE